MPARWPFTRRPPAPGADRAVVPGAVRGPAEITAPRPEASPLRHAALWTVAPDDERNRRHRLARGDGPTALQRPAIRAGPLDAATAPSPVTVATEGRGPATGDFSAIPAHLAARPADPRALHPLEAAGRASAPLPDKIRAPRYPVRSGKDP